MITRRQAILAVMSAPLAAGVAQASKLPAKPAMLTIDLNKWWGVVVKRNGEEIHITADEIMEALR